MAATEDTIVSSPAVDRFYQEQLLEELEFLYLQKLNLAIVSGNKHDIVHWRIRLIWLERKAIQLGL